MGRECGLELNKGKCEIIIHNMEDKPNRIEGIKVVNKIKYLGVTIDDARNIYKTQKKNIFEKAHRFANLTYSVIEKSCNKL